MNYEYYNPRKAALDAARELLTGAAKSAMSAGTLPEAELPDFIVEIPGDVKNGDIASNLAMAGARAFGKTGTAQQSKSHANHGLFVGFAPSDEPEIAFAIRIKNGYESLYVSEIGRDLMRYYYGLADRNELITGHAAEITVTGVHGD